MQFFYGTADPSTPVPGGALFFAGDLNYRLACGRAHTYAALQVGAVVLRTRTLTPEKLITKT
jgi:hypothetical protein